MHQDANFFSLEGIPEPWSQVFDWLTNGALAQCIKAGELDAATDVQLRLGFSYLHWAVKLKFNPQHPNPIPTPRNQKEACRPWGEVIAKTIELCEILWTKDCEYPCAAQWFYEVALEGAVTNPSVDIKAKNRRTKSIKKLRDENKILAKFSNPFNESEYPHTYKLLDIAICKRSFYLLEEFVSLRQKISTALEKDSHLRGYSEDEFGKPMRHVGGKGRGQTPIRFSPPTEASVFWANEKIDSLQSCPPFEVWEGTVCGLTLFPLIIHLCQKLTFWTGTASELLQVLHHRIDLLSASDTAWNLPKTPGLLSGELRKLLKKLEVSGIVVIFDRIPKKGTRIIYIAQSGVSCKLIIASLSTCPFPFARNSGLLPWRIE